MMTPKRQASTARAVALACAIALSAAGCASSGPASTAAAVVTSGSGGGNAGSGGSSGGGTRGGGDVPTTAYLSVTENYFADAAVVAPTGMARLRYAVTDQRTIARLAALINALPTDPRPEINPCPSALAPAYELDFQSAKDAKPVAEVAVVCFGVYVTVNGQREQLLNDATAAGKTSFLAAVTSLLAGYVPHHA
jgi:hypothetical protein